MLTTSFFIYLIWLWSLPARKSLSSVQALQMGEEKERKKREEGECHLTRQMSTLASYLSKYLQLSVSQVVLEVHVF